MNIPQTEQQYLEISQEKLLTLVRVMLGGGRGREDDEHPLPPGPWDPVIRQALERISVFGPRPEPWRVFDQTTLGNPVPWRNMNTVFGPRPEPWQVFFTNILTQHPEIWDAIIPHGHSYGDEVALNPQPLPPRYALMAAMAKAVITRAEMLQEISDATMREGEQQGIIIVSGYISRFVDDYCGNDFRLRYPFPGPRPHWFANELEGIDLLVMALEFEQAAIETFSPDLQRDLANAGARFVEAGLARMQPLNSGTDYAGKRVSTNGSNT